MNDTQFLALTKYLHSISWSLALLVFERTNIPRETRDMAFATHKEARKFHFENFTVTGVPMNKPLEN